MKIKIIIVLVGIFMLCITSCGNSGKPKQYTEEELTEIVHNESDKLYNKIAGTWKTSNTYSNGHGFYMEMTIRSDHSLVCRAVDASDGEIFGSLSGDCLVKPNLSQYLEHMSLTDEEKEAWKSELVIIRFDDGSSETYELNGNRLESEDYTFYKK